MAGSGPNKPSRANETPRFSWAFLLLAVFSCGSGQARALTVAGCVAELAASVPPGARIPDDPAELTTEELELAARLVEGVRECRAKGR